MMETIGGKRFRFVVRNAGDVDALAIEVEDKKLAPLARVLPELWLGVRARALAAVGRREGYEVPGAGFAYREDGRVEVFAGEARVSVSASLFEALVKIYDRRWSELLPSPSKT